MSTKAEVLAAIEGINKAVQAAALVAAELEEAVPEPEGVTNIVQLSDDTLLVQGKGPARWTYVSNTGPNYPWYGVVQDMTMPFSINPKYAKKGDFVKVLYGDNYTMSLDGPKSTVPPTVAASGPRAFIRQHAVGMNIERLRPLTMSYQGTPLTQEPYYRYLASKGIDFVRFFIPYRHDRDMGIGTGVPSVGQYDGLLDAAQAAMLAGLSVYMGCTDVVGEGEIDFNNWNKHADNVARRVAERGFQPNKFALEVANELAGNDNHFWNKMRLDVHDTIRARLPNHTIVHGCCGWNGVSGWDDTWEPPSDNNIILQFHDYSSNSKDSWRQIGDRLIAFAERHGTVMVNGEQGYDFDKAGQEHINGWVDNFRNCHPLIRTCPWTVTDGSTFRLNRSSGDPTLLPIIESTMAAMKQDTHNTPGWGV